MEQVYKYELHCHTSEGSKCAKTSARDMVDFYKKAGYTGIIITDHFFNGNTTVPKDLEWEERIELYCKGYENAKKRGDEIGLDVFWGWEFDGDFVTLGLDKEWLKRNKNLDLLPGIEYLDYIRSQDGYLIHAHPVRVRPHIRTINVSPMKVDAIEVINAANRDFENKMADYIATQYGITKVCGSDNHEGLKEKLASLELDFKVGSLEELISALKENKHVIKEYDVSEVDGEILLKEHIPEDFNKGGNCR